VYTKLSLIWALKDFAQGSVGTANPWAKEGRRCARLLRFVEGSITGETQLHISQPAIIYVN